MVAVFGLSKAIANLFTGKLIAEIGRKAHVTTWMGNGPASADVTVTPFRRQRSDYC